MASAAQQDTDRRRSRQWERMQQLGWVTMEEAAKRARRSLRTVYRWRDEALRQRKGTPTSPAEPQIEVRQIGKTWYVSTQSLQKMLGPLADIAPGSPSK